MKWAARAILAAMLGALVWVTTIINCGPVKSNHVAHLIGRNPSLFVFLLIIVAGCVLILLVMGAFFKLCEVAFGDDRD